MFFNTIPNISSNSSNSIYQTDFTDEEKIQFDKDFDSNYEYGYLPSIGITFKSVNIDMLKKYIEYKISLIELFISKEEFYPELFFSFIFKNKASEYITTLNYRLYQHYCLEYFEYIRNMLENENLIHPFVYLWV